MDARKPRLSLSMAKQDRAFTGLLSHGTSYVFEKLVRLAVNTGAMMTTDTRRDGKVVVLTVSSATW